MVLDKKNPWKTHSSHIEAGTDFGIILRKRVCKTSLYLRQLGNNRWSLRTCKLSLRLVLHLQHFRDEWLRPQFAGFPRQGTFKSLNTSFAFYQLPFSFPNVKYKFKRSHKIAHHHVLLNNRIWTKKHIINYYWKVYLIYIKYIESKWVSFVLSKLPSFRN